MPDTQADLTPSGFNWALPETPYLKTKHAERPIKSCLFIRGIGVFGSAQLKDSSTEVFCHRLRPGADVQLFENPLDVSVNGAVADV